MWSCLRPPAAAATVGREGRGDAKMDIHSIDWNAVPWERVREGVERKAFSGEGATVSLNRLQPGHEPRPHSHPHEQIVYIMAGQIDFHIGETVTRLAAGGLLVVPPNARHWGVVDRKS